MSQTDMSDKAISFEGIVVEVNKGSNFIVRTDAGHDVLATLSGKLRENKIRILTNDRVRIEVSPYDLTRGRIVTRYG